MSKLKCIENFYASFYCGLYSRIKEIHKVLWVCHFKFHTSQGNSAFTVWNKLFHAIVWNLYYLFNFCLSFSKILFGLHNGMVLYTSKYFKLFGVLNVQLSRIVMQQIIYRNSEQTRKGFQLGSEFSKETPHQIRNLKIH